MKFIHAADLHLDSVSSKVKSFYGQKDVSILEASQRAFVSLIELAQKEKVDFLLLSGDVFDANWKDYGVGLFFIQQIKRLNCPVYYIRGNHDSENRLLKSLPYPKNLHIFQSEKAHTIIDEKLKVAIHGQSYSHYHIKDDLLKDYPKKISGYFNIGLLHTSGEKNNGEDPYAPYDKKRLYELGYEYWGLGHIHSAKILDTNPYIVYSGTIQGRHIKEGGQKGCYLINTDGLEVSSIEFKSLNNVTWETLSINLLNSHSEKDLLEIFKKEIFEKFNILPGDQKLVVRVIFVGNNQLEKTINQHKEYWRNALYCVIEDRLKERVYIEKVIDKTKRINKELKPSSMVKHLLQELDLPQVGEEFNAIYQEEKNKLLQNLPFPILNEINDDELKGYVENMEEVKSYILESLSEGK